MSGAALAAVLAELAAEIEHLGAALCSDAAIARRHAPALQAIDLIAQTQRAVADILAAPCQPCAIDAVPLEALRARLAAALGTCDEEGAHGSGQLPGAAVNRC